MRRARSITVPIVLLVIAAALIATTVQFTSMFSGPPPWFRPVPVARVAEALRTGAVPDNARGIEVTHIDEDRFGRSEEQPSPERDAAIAALIPAPAASVHGLYEFPPHDPDSDIRGSFTVGRRDGDGWIIVSTAPPPTFTSWHFRRLAGMLITLAVLSVLAWYVARRISRPIRELAYAATRARLGARPAIPRGGPREVRELAEAVEAMQDRILQQAEGRTAMLAAIAHDLGTPLSRIAFWVEQLPEAARDRASADIDEMRAMLGAVLRFTRDDRSREQHARLDLGSLIESLGDDLAAAGLPVEVDLGPRVVIDGDTVALRRLFANLVENAVRYGDRARLCWSVSGGWAEVLVEDEGPGFPAGRAEALFAPFVRGEGSRNRATGGTGLGLAIVRSIAEAHGGEVLLENRDAGGGRVRVRLPAG
ncbi:ATP-binding protein [Sphingomonas psychrotolerans]|uniref:histidine kinase n=1 Tax=Sphingomonas psychrotolerans TaxID=1327635 RepID=A0ABU3N590_9SPHN|nr:ATP-binding protein [Sphingomonas psychrotolerans]MDT8759702.1 ATP-binding protein [Sphingomonas psychrotolerans]